MKFRFAPRLARLDDRKPDVDFRALGFAFAMTPDGEIRIDGALGNEFAPDVVLASATSPLAYAPEGAANVRGLIKTLFPVGAASDPGVMVPLTAESRILLCLPVPPDLAAKSRDADRRELSVPCGRAGCVQTGRREGMETGSIVKAFPIPDDYSVDRTHSHRPDPSTSILAVADRPGHVSRRSSPSTVRGAVGGDGAVADAARRGSWRRSRRRSRGCRGGTAWRSRDPGRAGGRRS